MEWEICTMFLPLKRHRENGLLIGMVAVPPPNFRGAPKKTKIIGADLSKKLNLGGRAKTLGGGGSMNPSDIIVDVLKDITLC